LPRAPGTGTTENPQHRGDTDTSHDEPERPPGHAPRPLRSLASALGQRTGRNGGGTERMTVLLVQDLVKAPLALIGGADHTQFTDVTPEPLTGLPREHKVRDRAKVRFADAL